MAPMILKQMNFSTAKPRGEILEKLPHCYFSRAPDERRTLTDGFAAVYILSGEQETVTGILYETADTDLGRAIGEAFEGEISEAA